MQSGMNGLSRILTAELGTCGFFGQVVFRETVSAQQNGHRLEV